MTRTKEVERPSIRAMSIWVVGGILLAALLIMILAGCTQAASPDIPTASPRQETTPSETSLPAVEALDADADAVTANESQETVPADTNSLAVELADTDADVVTANESQETTVAETNPASVEPEDAALAFARCIRENGVPDFPDPGPEGIMITRGQVNFNDPRYQAAMEACQDLRPAGTGSGMGMGGMQGGMDEETQFAFARCMRENGVPDFPDPSSESGAGGRVIVGQGQGAGSNINPNDPRFQSAFQICRETILEGAQ